MVSVNFLNHINSRVLVNAEILHVYAVSGKKEDKCSQLF